MYVYIDFLCACSVLYVHALHVYAQVTIMGWLIGLSIDYCVVFCLCKNI